MSCRAVLALALLLAACDAPLAGPDTGSNTNWLRACETDGECGGTLGCYCGTCTLACASDTDCDALGAGRCAAPDDPATASICRTGEALPSGGVCLPSCQPGTCASDQACVAGGCVPAALPANDFCDPVAERREEDRVHEEELLSLLASLRVGGGETCGGGTPAPAVPALRLEPRLHCEARVLAVDLDGSGTLGLVDSSGRTTDDRLALSGYTAGPWGESYARGTTPEAALGGMLADLDSCQRFVDAAYLDVGVGRAGDVSIVTLASE